MSRRFVTKGAITRLTLAAEERELLSQLPDELRVLYGSDAAGDPVVQRLFPRAYLDPTEDTSEEVWQALQRPELLRQRIAALDALVAVLNDARTDRKGRVIVELSDDDRSALLRVLNDARLTLGTRLEVSDDTDIDDLDPSRLDPGDPRAAALAAYGWLSYLEGELVESLLDELPG